MAWTEEKVFRLTKLANDGLTASEIAAFLTTRSDIVTRNAVIGKLKRIGVPLQGIYMQVRSPESRARDFISRKRMARARLAKASTAKPISAKLLERQAKEFLYKPFISDGDDFQPGMYGILDIPNFKCRYAVSAEGSPLRFCGKAFDIKQRQWWCEEHQKVVFRKQEKLGK